MFKFDRRSVECTHTDRGQRHGYGTGKFERENLRKRF